MTKSQIQKVALIGLTALLSLNSASAAIPKTFQGLINFALQLLNFFMAVFIVAVGAFILKLGWDLVTSGGDKTKVGAAKENIKWIAWGIVAALLSTSAYWIMKSFLEGSFSNPQSPF